MTEMRPYDPAKPRRIFVVDQTIREGMQYRGLMLDKDERLRILRFQESLGVDIMQGGYPPAHGSEVAAVKYLQSAAVRNGLSIRIAGDGRVLTGDAKLVIDMGLSDFHLHTSVNRDLLKRLSKKVIFKNLKETVELIRMEAVDPCIKISLIDIGNSDSSDLLECSTLLVDDLKVEILTLADTSGTMAPNLFSEKIHAVVHLIKGTHILMGVHCHNDLGMANANTIMGVAEGASVVDVSALGIGERNGIADMFIVGKILKDQGYELRLKIENIDVFNEYYHFINELCRKKTGMGMMHYNTPFFGDSMKTHVAGTHAISKFGVAAEESFYLNVLCGKNMVRKYLQLHNMAFNENHIEHIVREIKDRSVKSARHVSKSDILDILKRVQI